MTDVPVPIQVKGGAAANQQKQLIMLAVLGVVLLLAVVFFVVKPFSGSDSPSTPAPPVTSAPATGTEGATVSTPSEPVPTTAPVARPGRNPFDGG